MFEAIGSESVKLAMDKADDLLDKADNLVRDAEMRLGGLVHGILDRFDIEIHFKINQPKAKAANPVPEQDKIY